MAIHAVGMNCLRKSLTKEAKRTPSRVSTRLLPVDISEDPRLSYLMPYSNLSSQSDVFPIPECIPIFPLPNVVFFPQTYLPLHIFEPRYRQMVADASQKGHCIGMALLKEGWEEQYYGNPPVHSLGCVGRLVNIKQLEDGRSNVILEGLQRYTIEEELPRVSYRLAKITLKPLESKPALDKATRSMLIQTTRSYLRAKKAPELSQLISISQPTDSVLVHSLSSCLDFTPLEKQFLLESETLLQQARRFINLLQFRHHQPSDCIGWG